MGQKDITEKTLEAYNDVFADIVNVLLFNGDRVVDENDLLPDETHSAYKAENKIKDQERDVSKFWNKSNIRMALLGIENQTEIERNMPLRVIGYDGAAYRNQLSNKDKQKTNYPVVTMILYFGEKPWRKNRSLVEALDIPERLRPFVSDYNINVFEIAYLTDEQVGMFKSDFKIIADYFVQLRKTKEYVPMPDYVTHVWETLNLMSVLTDDDRFEKAVTDLEGKERVNMCEVIDSYINKGIERGIEQGIERGIEQGIERGIEQGANNEKTNIIIKLYGKLNDIDEVARLLDMEKDEIEKIVK